MYCSITWLNPYWQHVKIKIGILMLFWNLESGFCFRDMPIWADMPTFTFYCYMPLRGAHTFWMILIHFFSYEFHYRITSSLIFVCQFFISWNYFLLLIFVNIIIRLRNDQFGDETFYSIAAVKAPLTIGFARGWKVMFEISKDFPISQYFQFNFTVRLVVYW